ncbi:V3 protein [Persimmon circular DNA virus]|nr:V3 protein [Persimmon circular DNA virus]
MYTGLIGYWRLMICWRHSSLERWHCGYVRKMLLELIRNWAGGRGILVNMGGDTNRSPGVKVPRMGVTGVAYIPPQVEAL